MSAAILNAVRAVRTTPTAKAVLVAMAYYGDAEGRCLVPLSVLCEFTCLSDRAVRYAVRELEECGIVASERASGRISQFSIRPQIARTTPASGAGLKDTGPRHVVPDDPGTTCRSPTPAPDAAPAPHAVVYAQPRQEVPGFIHTPRHHVPHPPAPHAGVGVSGGEVGGGFALTLSEKKVTKKKQTKSPVVEVTVLELVASGLDEKLAADFLAHRKTKKAPLTPRAWAGMCGEAAKAGWALQAAVEKTITRNWIAFDADFVAPEPKINGAAPRQSRLTTPTTEQHEAAGSGW